MIAPIHSKKTLCLAMVIAVYGCSQQDSSKRGIAPEPAFSIECAGSTGNFNEEDKVTGRFRGILTIDAGLKQVFGSNVSNNGSTWKFLFLNNEIVRLVSLDRAGIVFDNGQEVEIVRATGKMKVSFVPEMDITCKLTDLIPIPRQTL